MTKHGLVNQCTDLWYRYYYKNYISLRYQFKVGHEKFKEALKNTFAGDIDYTKAPSNAVLMFKLGFAWGIESK